MYIQLATDSASSMMKYDLRNATTSASFIQSVGKQIECAKVVYYRKIELSQRKTGGLMLQSVCKSLNFKLAQCYMMNY
jgi:hypothetical protein